MYSRGTNSQRANAFSDCLRHESVYPTCLAQLVEGGQLKWSDPVVRHLPEFELYDPYLTKEVTCCQIERD